MSAVLNNMAGKNSAKYALQSVALQVVHTLGITTEDKLL